MFRRTASRIAIASAVMLVAGGALATPAMAAAGQVGPKQYFYGEFFPAITSAAQDVIQVSCPTPAALGNPLAGQYVAAHEVFPPVLTTIGYTGNLGTEIDVDLSWPYPVGGGGTPVFAKLTYYDTKAEIPTTLEVPCAGTGVLAFAPNLNDGTGRTSYVDVTFKGIP